MSPARRALLSVNARDLSLSLAKIRNTFEWKDMWNGP